MSKQEIPSSSPLSSVHSEPDFPRTLAEQRLGSYQPVDEHDTTQKLLSIFIQELPEEGAINICNDIDGCTSDEEIHQLAAHLFESIMKPMKGRPKSPSPILSPRLGAFESIDRMVAELPESNSRVQQSKLRKNCLLRDNNKCVVSGFYDTYEFEKLPDEQKGEMTMTGKCEAAHIFPFCLGKYSDTELSATSIIWESLYRCFPLIQSHAGLSVDSINATFNALILYAPLHEEFGNFKLAFEPTVRYELFIIRVNILKFPGRGKHVQDSYLSSFFYGLCQGSSGRWPRNFHSTSWRKRATCP